MQCEAELTKIILVQRLTCLICVFGVSQILGGDSIIKAQCKTLIKDYVPQILEIIDTLPADEV